MAATYDLSTNVGKIRLLIPDKDVANATFQDDEIEYFLASEGGNIRFAAALALEIAAVDEVLTFKVLKSGTDSVDGSKTADALMKRAAWLRGQGTELDFEGQVGVIEQAHGIFGRRQRFWNEVLRS